MEEIKTFSDHHHSIDINKKSLHHSLRKPSRSDFVQLKLF